MKQIRLFLIIAVSVLLSQVARADTFWTEQFSGYVDGRLGDSGVGGGGTIPGWYTPQNGVTITNSLGSLDAEALGLVASDGAKVRVSNAGITNLVGSYNKFVQPGAFPQANPTNLYYSFLYKFVNAADVPTSSSTRIIGVNRENSGVTSEATFHWWLTASNTGSAIQIGINKYLGVTNFATTNISAGQTVLIVVRQQILTGVNNDIEDLWIDPPTNTFGLGEGSVPPVAATVSDGTEDPSTTGPGRFHIPQWVNAEVDEIRVASTWAEATIPKGTCIAAKIVSSPTNITQVSEIGATFRVDAGNSTSPSYQWQISQDGGTTWNNITGADAKQYVTPNLFIGSDQGNKYRAVITVDCNASSITSAVATVTLTSPTPTANGVIMHDQFTDTYRDVGPVTQSNSVWFTSLAFTAFLDAISGDLVGTPQTATSSLWLGFFTETNALPVHLDIAKKITVTMPFTPNSFSSHTNNGALRFGLFDYYDGAARPTADAATLTGSSGQGMSVRGYMLSIDFGTVFTANSPLSLLVRTGLGDNNLMGTTGDYVSMGSGPSGGGYTNAAAFVGGTPYTLEFSVWRIATNSVEVTATISGGGSNWTYTATETNAAYHRFDSFAIRPNSLETAADSFPFPEFKVEVTTTNPPVPNIITNLPAYQITEGKLLSPTLFKLTWQSTNGVSYDVLSRTSLSTGTWITNASVVATGLTTSYTNTQSAGVQNFYRISAPLPQTLP